MNEDAELRKLQAEVDNEPDNYDAWAKLVAAAENLEGGLHRNSLPEHIKATRDIYDRFLAKFPLFFGYWKKYADLEFNIAGTEAAENIYERGTASVHSVDLWKDYCAFKAETCHDPEVTRELFERGANAIGLDFLAHPFWDKYIEFEDRSDSPDRVFAILSRIIHYPMHQYARYFDRFIKTAQSRPVEELAPSDIVAQYRAESNMQQPGKDTQQVDEEVRTRLMQQHNDTYARTASETSKRWTYEQEIKRPYFHVTELDEPQLSNWRKYLDFEESEGNHQRTTFLYERCIVACAHYDEFWLRYARWMLSQPEKAEEVRHIYMRASCLYCPIARPTVRLHWAFFEESQGYVSTAHAIYDAVLAVMPGHVETIAAWAQSARRNEGLEAARQVYKTQLDADFVDPTSKAQLISDYARLVYKLTSDPREATSLFESNQDKLRSSKDFWTAWLTFENDCLVPEDVEQNQQINQRVKAVWNTVRSSGALPADAVKEIGEVYMRFLLERGGKDAAKEYMLLDREMNGYAGGK